MSCPVLEKDSVHQLFRHLLLGNLHRGLVKSGEFKVGYGGEARVCNGVLQLQEVL